MEKGSEIRALAQGEVVFADRLSGYGQILIIDHGSGYHSLYAHLSEFLVEVGEEINDRQIIALSGDSGSLEGPKFYFELRARGLPVDPQEWFVR